MPVLQDTHPWPHLLPIPWSDPWQPPCKICFLLIRNFTHGRILLNVSTVGKIIAMPFRFMDSKFHK